MLMMMRKMIINHLVRVCLSFHSPNMRNPSTGLIEYLGTDITAAIDGIKCKVNKLTTLKTANITIPGNGYGKVSLVLLYSKERELKSKLCRRRIELGLRLGNAMPVVPIRAFWKMDPDKQIGMEFRMIVIDSHMQLIGDVIKTLAFGGGMLYCILYVCTFSLTYVQNSA